MNEITQGTIISSIRSDKYPEIECKAIVISARCDIANCKIQKFHYLTAIPISEWAFSKEGIDKWLIPEFKQYLDGYLKNNGLDLETLLSFSEEEVKRIFDETIKPIKKDEERKKEIALSKLQFILKSNSIAMISRNMLDEIIFDKKSWKDLLITYIVSELSAGKNSQLTFIPPKEHETTICEGLLIDNTEINFFDEKTLQTINDNKMDEKSLNDKEKNFFNDKFFIKNGSGFSIIEGTLPSPWIEYVLQRFSNFFTRIGVYTPTKEQISDLFYKDGKNDEICFV